MIINFTMSEVQKKLQYDVRAFAENVLAPVVPLADREPGPLRASAMTKPPYIEAYRIRDRDVHAAQGVRRGAGCRASIS